MAEDMVDLSPAERRAWLCRNFGDGPQEWMPELSDIYRTDQAIWGTEPPSKAGFRAWLVAMIGEDEAVEQTVALYPA